MPQLNTFGQDITKYGGSVVPTSTIPAINSSMLQQQPTITLPPPPPPLNPQATNVSVPSPLQIVTDANAQTATDQKQSSLLNSIADLTKDSPSLSTLQLQQENQAGIPGLNKTVNDLTTQIMGLNDQATALQNEAQYTIPNQATIDATGRMSTAGLNSQTQIALRQNQIKQGAIATQALTLKAAYYAANGNLSLAKDAADKAAQVQFDAQQQQLNYQKAQLDALAPTLNREEQARATIVKAQLDDRQQQINNGIEDKKTITALAIAAMKNFPNDPAAQYAAQQAMKAGDLQTAFGLVGKYQQDPLATQQALLDQQKTRAQIAEANASVAKINNDIKNSQPVVVSGDNAPYINAFNNAVAGMGAQAATQAKTVFAGYINRGDLEGAKNYVVRTALANAGVDQQNQAIGRSQALTALNDIQSLLAQAQAKGIDTNILTGNATNVAEKLGATNNPDLSYISSRILAILQTYRRAMTGVAFSPAESAQYEKLFPGTTKNGDLNTAKISALVDSLNSNNKAALSFYIGDQNYDALFPNQSTATLPSNKSQSVPSGQTTTINGHQYKSDGTQWVLVQ